MTHIASPMKVEVLLPVPFDHGFDYAVPNEYRDQLTVGSYVSVPFGRQHLVGIVWGTARGDVAPAKIKTISRIFSHVPPMHETMRDFLTWVAWYNVAPLGAVLKLAMPDTDHIDQPFLPRYVRRNLSFSGSLTPAQKRVLKHLPDNHVQTFDRLIEAAGTTPKLLQHLLTQGSLVASEGEGEREDASVQPLNTELTPEQTQAAELLRRNIGAGFSVTLLDGVTGSGKTEVYFDTIAHTLAQGKQALVLLPEIALALPWVERFTKRFGTAPVVWHSGLSAGQRKTAWARILQGQCGLIVGARSALFLPHTHLGLIIIDEEHDSSYKQDEGVHYHARDMAIARAHHEKIPVVLVSATPSLETVSNIEQGRYQVVHLRARYAAAQLPSVTLVDMRANKMPSGQFLSEPLRDRLLHTLAQGHQSLLFINRRGYAPLVLCQSCGHRLQCPQCSAWLVVHRKHPCMQCHHCGYSAPLPHECPACHETDALKAFGPGVERIAEEIHTIAPHANIALMTSDHVSTPAQMGALLEAIIDKRIDVVVGTQMIAKGHHFPHLALVGVVDGDMGLAGADFRASERTFQMLHQVAGRAGREHTAGEVMIQTFMPEHPVMQALQALDRDGLMAAEMQERQAAGWPPYGRLVGIVIDGENIQEVQRAAQMLARQAPLAEGLRVLGPAPAPLSMLRGKHRFRLLIKASKQSQVQRWLVTWLAQVKLPKSVRVRVDVDPQSFV